MIHTTFTGRKIPSAISKMLGMRFPDTGENAGTLGLLLPEGGQQRFPQIGHEHGLGAEGRHAGGPGLHFNIRPVIGGEDDDGSIVPQGPDLPGDLDAVQIRQTPVDDVGVEGIVQFQGLSGPEDGLFAGKGPL